MDIIHLAQISLSVVKMHLQKQFRCQTIIILSFLILLTSHVSGHGRLRDPPSRSSAWREGFKTPPDFNDMEGFCGGFERQWLVNKGKCGVCGDAYDELVKPHEAPGGIFATGTIVRSYTEGQIIPVKLEITAMHKGFYEFKICPNNNIKQDPPQECFDRFPLNFVNGSPTNKVFIDSLANGMYQTRLQLPPGLTCSQCIIQWTYQTGNRWGVCSNGTQGLGCGPQETFRACADVSITSRNGAFAPVSTDRPMTSPSIVTPDPIMVRPLITAIPPVPTVLPTTGGRLPCQRYGPSPNQLNVAGMTEWCNNNCPKGNCPLENCVCIDL